MQAWGFLEEKTVWQLTQSKGKQQSVCLLLKSQILGTGQVSLIAVGFCEASLECGCVKCVHKTQDVMQFNSHENEPPQYNRQL